MIKKGILDTSRMERHFDNILFDDMGLDSNDPNLEDTPKRLVRMYLELFRNIDREFDEWAFFPNQSKESRDGGIIFYNYEGNETDVQVPPRKKYNQIVMVDNIHFTSMCSHHFLPFTGKAWILYIPRDNLVGVSKMARVVEHYAARPQLQETLCHEIFDNIMEKVEPLGCMIVIRATHSCMACRGVKQYDGAGVTTSAISALFEDDPSAKHEALDLIKLSMR